ncbi:hypothetical protein K438DRAFT_1518237, partial [Mycena galopus ATCC 62051]
TAFLFSILAQPLVSLFPFPVAVLLYILAPALVILQLFLEITVFSPYRAIVFASDAIYPVYVFLGIACITGALLGWVGRSV